MDRPGTCEVQQTATFHEPLVLGFNRTGPAKKSPLRGSEQEGRDVEPGDESISRQASAAGSRSAFIVLTTLGNLAHEDPAEGRGASRGQTHS